VNSTDDFAFARVNSDLFIHVVDKVVICKASRLSGNNLVHNFMQVNLLDLRILAEAEDFVTHVLGSKQVA